jgi:hypothetical protein
MRLLILSLFLLTAVAADAQKVTGSWYGVADVAAGGMGNNYLTELIIKQSGNEVEGIFGYYFRDGYQSYYIRGTFNAQTRQLSIPNLPVTYFRSNDIDGIDCPMDFTATLLVSPVKSTLKGELISQKKYRYTCPALRVNYALDVSEQNQDSLIRHSSAGSKKYWKPRNDDLVITTKDPPPYTGKPDSSAFDQMLPPLPDRQDLGALGNAIEKTDSIARKREEIKKLVASFEQRKNILSKEIEIESDSVRISFYDNGDIDGDSITVFLNKYPVLTHQPLSAKSLNMYLAFDKGKDVAEISMYAENLGLYPPNTALMVISDGDKRYEVFMSSSLTQNSMVRLKKKKSAMKIRPE